MKNREGLQGIRASEFHYVSQSILSLTLLKLTASGTATATATAAASASAL